MKLPSWLPIVVVLVIVGSWVIYMIAIPNAFPGNGQAAAFGDMFGGLDALFSGLALAGVIYAILLQREDLKIQREELKLTRDEMQKSADALIDQAKSMEQSTELTVRNTIVSYYTVRLQLAVQYQFEPLLDFKLGHPDIYARQIEEQIKIIEKNLAKQDTEDHA